MAARARRPGACFILLTESNRAHRAVPAGVGCMEDPVRQGGPLSHRRTYWLRLSRAPTAFGLRGVRAWCVEYSQPTWNYLGSQELSTSTAGTFVPD